MYFPSTWPRKAYYSVTGEIAGKTLEDGNVIDPVTNRYESGKYYFTNDTHSVVELGTFTVGEEITVTFTQSEDNFYVLSSQNLFYSYDAELVEQIIGDLAPNQLNVTSFEEDRLSGDVTVEEDGTLFLTTIPYDKGWHILVDGKEVGYKKGLEAFITFELDKGEHNVEMYYMSDSFKYGAIISVTGLVLFILICIGEVVLPKPMKRLRALIVKKLDGPISKLKAIKLPSIVKRNEYVPPFTDIEEEGLDSPTENVEND